MVTEIAIIFFLAVIAAGIIVMALEQRYQSALIKNLITEFRLHFDDAMVRRIMKKMGVGRFH